MPGNKNKRGKGKRRNNKNKSFSASTVPNDAGRKAPTRVSMPTPTSTAATRPPVFAASARQRGQLYYESALGLTAPTSGNVVTYFFSANGIFDPNITGTGHQPIGFDQMMLFFEQATVLRSMIEVTFNIGPGLTVQCGVALFPDASALTNPQQLVENGLLRFKPITSGSSTFQNQLARTKVRLGCDVMKYFSRPTYQSMLNDDNLYCTAAANPVEQVYFGIVVWQISPDGSTTTTVGFDVTLSYDVIYWEPRKASISASLPGSHLSAEQRIKKTAQLVSSSGQIVEATVLEDFPEKEQVGFPDSPVMVRHRMLPGPVGEEKGN